MSKEKSNDKTCNNCKLSRPSGKDNWVKCTKKHNDLVLATASQCKTPYITNGDVIRQMSDGVLAFMMTRLILNGCPISGAKTFEEMQECIRSKDCTNCLKNYLSEEAIVATLEEVEKSEVKSV